MMADSVYAGSISGATAPGAANLSKSSFDVVEAYLQTIPLRSWDDETEIILGSGRFRYRMVNDWAKLPEGWRFLDVAAVAVDQADRVYVLCRGEHPIMVFDRAGNLLDHWGAATFSRPHGIHLGPDGMLYVADDGHHCVRKCTPDGKVLMTLGTPGKPAPFMSGLPFSRCTDVALGPQSEIYVSDGYYNGRVHKYSSDGNLLKSWGGPGTGIGEFNIAHNICADEGGWVYVADRENHRVQVFDGNGKYITQWNNLSRTQALERDRDGLFYLGELGPKHYIGNRHIPNIGPRISILNDQGELLARLGTLPSGHAPDRFLSPHGLAIDSRGDIYVGEVSFSSWEGSFPKTVPPTDLRTLRKLVRLRAEPATGTS